MGRKASMNLHAGSVSNFTATPPSVFSQLRQGAGEMDSFWDASSLTDLSELIWTQLVQAEGNPGHPWRLPVLATGARSHPNARVVVLRGVTRPGFELLAFSDSRTSKVAELSKNPHGVWLFYDPREQVQVRAFSEVRLHTDDAVADTYWHRLPDGSRHNYLTEEAPGSEAPEPSRGRILAPGSAGRFSVIVGKVTRLDWLWLKPEGHRRAQFRRSGTTWDGSWLVP